MAKQAQIDAVRPVLTKADKAVTAVEHALDAVEVGADTAASVVESGLEKVADVVPETLDKTVHVAAEATKKGVGAFRNPKVMIIALGVAGAAAGAALGVVAYRIQRKRLEKEFEEKLETQLDEMREFYIRRYKAGEFTTPRTAAEKLLIDEAADAATEYAGEQDGPAVPEQTPAETPEPPPFRPEGLTEPDGRVRYDKVIRDSEAAEEIRQSAVKIVAETPVTPPPVVAPVGEPIKRNVFVDNRQVVPDPTWNQEAEEAHRQEEVPYVISHDEFMENSFEHEQTTMTWYDADETLADAKEEIVHEVESTVGVDNMDRFGHGSRDPKIVYIRNERLEMDFEVAKSEGSFAEEVMGLQHSDETRFRRARPRRGEDE